MARQSRNGRRERWSRSIGRGRYTALMRTHCLHRARLLTVMSIASVLCNVTPSGAQPATTTSPIAGAAAAWQPLFNGTDLAGWETYLGKPEPMWDVPGMPRDAEGNYREPIGTNRDPLKVFTVVEVDGKPALRVSGQGFGVITTKRSFANYHLRFQFKWGEDRWPPRADMVRDSGLLYHVHGAPAAIYGVWPRCVEFQIQDGDTGDLWTLGTRIDVRATRTTNADGKPGPYRYDPQAEPTRFVEQSQNGNRCIKHPNAERPRGEWNTLELICLNGDSVHVVNGQVVMRLHNAERLDGEAPRWNDKQPSPLREGPIALQTEGAEVFYREIEFREILDWPAGVSEGR